MAQHRSRRPSEPRPFRPTIVRYVSPQGKRCKAKDPGAKKIKTRSRTYVADLYDRGKRERVSLRTTDLGDAWVELRRLLRERREEDAGLRTGLTEHAARPVLDHLADWAKAMREGGAEPEYLALCEARIKKLAELAGWRRAADIDQDSAKAALQRLGREPKRGTACATRGGRSAQTRNHYLVHAKQFARWLWLSGRLPAHPLAKLRPESVSADRRHDRRVATDHEAAQLFAHLAGEGAKVLRGMTGPTRALGYQVCMGTGLRSKELKRLTPESFDLERGTLTVLGKNKLVETLHLPPWLTALLGAFLPGKAAGGQLWPFPTKKPGRVLRIDLKAAGVAYVLPGPRGPLYMDFHGLRHWFVTVTAHLPGVDLKTLMEAARLSSPSLALKVYTHAREERRRAAAEGVPPPPPPPPQPPSP